MLGKLGEAGAKAGDALQAYNPATPGYLALKARLAALRGPAPTAVKPLRLPSGPALRLGMRDARVPLLRAHFGLESAPGRHASTAGPASRRTTMPSSPMRSTKFQRGRGLPATAS